MCSASNYLTADYGFQSERVVAKPISSFAYQIAIRPIVKMAASIIYSESLSKGTKDWSLACRKLSVNKIYAFRIFLDNNVAEHLYMTKSVRYFDVFTRVYVYLGLHVF